MARLYADEQFPARATRRLRLLGHDVLTVQQTNVSKYGDAKSDEEVLRFATNDDRAVVTLNRQDFVQLAREIHWHCGIITCLPDKNPDRLARKIDSAIKDVLREHATLKGRIVRVAYRRADRR